MRTINCDLFISSHLAEVSEHHTVLLIMLILTHTTSTAPQFTLSNSHIKRKHRNVPTHSSKWECHPCFLNHEGQTVQIIVFSVCYYLFLRSCRCKMVALRGQCVLPVPARHCFLGQFIFITLFSQNICAIISYDRQALLDHESKVTVISLSHHDLEHYIQFFVTLTAGLPVADEQDDQKQRQRRRRGRKGIKS